MPTERINRFCDCVNKKEDKMKSIFSLVVSYLADYINLILYGLCFAAGVAVTALYYRHDIAQVELAQSKALAEQRLKTEKGLSDATNTILTAQEQYSAVVSERDALIERLRVLNENSMRKSADSADALRKRVAACERMASGLLELSKRCGDGWQRCATRHDALVEVVK